MGHAWCFAQPLVAAPHARDGVRACQVSTPLRALTSALEGDGCDAQRVGRPQGLRFDR